MSIKTLNNLKRVVLILKKFEKRTAGDFFKSGNPRFPHWYKLELYSDGSGHVEDTNLKEIKFRFDNPEELYFNLTK